MHIFLFQKSEVVVQRLIMTASCTFPATGSHDEHRVGKTGDPFYSRTHFAAVEEQTHALTDFFVHHHSTVDIIHDQLARRGAKLHDAELFQISRRCVDIVWRRQINCLHKIAGSDAAGIAVRIAVPPQASGFIGAHAHCFRLRAIAEIKRTGPRRQHFASGEIDREFGQLPQIMKQDAGPGRPLAGVAFDRKRMGPAVSQVIGPKTVGGGIVRQDIAWHFRIVIGMQMQRILMTAFRLRPDRSAHRFQRLAPILRLRLRSRPFSGFQHRHGNVMSPERTVFFGDPVQRLRFLNQLDAKLFRIQPAVLIAPSGRITGGIDRFQILGHHIKNFAWRRIGHIDSRHCRGLRFVDHEPQFPGRSQIYGGSPLRAHFPVQRHRLADCQTTDLLMVRSFNHQTVGIRLHQF